MTPEEEYLMNPRWLVVLIGTSFDRAASVHTVYCRSEETAKALVEWANTLWKVKAKYFEDLSPNDRRLLEATDDIEAGNVVEFDPPKDRP
jgi:hypothetical protein